MTMTSPAANLLDGKALAKSIRDGHPARAAALAARLGRAPKLAIVLAGNDPSAEAYLKSKLKACEKSGIETALTRLPEADDAALAGALRALGDDDGIDGILLEQPLPKGLDLEAALEAIAPEKDVEGVTARNFGLLFSAKTLDEIRSRGAFIPCTAYAILRLLQESGEPVEGLDALVVGRSNIVGKPAAHLLSCLNATTTLAHSRTRDLGGLAARADVVVCAVGKAKWLKKVKPGAIVLDAGINYEGPTMVGDADFDAVAADAKWITPVPGGVGPVTVALLLENILTAAERKAA